MSWNLDFSDFDPKSLSSWIFLVNFIPRFPYLYIADAVTSCFIVRSSLRIRNPLISFVLGLSLATFSDNYEAVLSNRKLATFEHPWLTPVFAAVWLAFNFFPYDLLFKVSKFVSSIGAAVSGFLVARDAMRGVDLGVTHYPTNWIPVILTSVFCGAGKYIFLHAYSAFYRQKARSAGPIILGTTTIALSYYWFTDFGHISNTLWFDKEETRLVLLIVLSLFAIVHSIVDDCAFTAIYDAIGSAIGVIIPYYGAMWTPTLEIVKHVATGQVTPEKTKVKTE
jgi:hypothetical protein